MTKSNFMTDQTDQYQTALVNNTHNERAVEATEKTVSAAPAQSEMVTAQNNIVDVFEFEPVGFMSNGRW